MAVRFQVRGDTAANWTDENPVLLAREIAIETDTNSLKIGDGITAWNALAYAFNGGAGGVLISGTPVDDQIAVWANATTLEGVSGLTYDGVDFGVTGNIVVSGTIDGRDVATDGTKLDGVEALADVTDAANVAAAGAAMAANNLSDLADAATSRGNLGVDAAGTDNSTDVTLAGTPDYITIAGQVITRGQVDLAADITGTLSVASGGTGATSAAAARLNLGAGDVTKVATPAGNQVGVWTGSGTLEGTDNLWFDGASLGIGTNDPKEALHVSGAVVQSGDQFLGHNIYFDTYWRYIGSGHGGTLKLSDINGDLDLRSTAVSGAADGIGSMVRRAFYDLSSNAWVFYTAGVEALRLTSDEVTQVQGAAADVRTLSVNTTLQAADSGRMLRCTAAITLSGTASLVAGSRTTVIAAGGDVIVDGAGATNATVSNGDIGVIVHDGTDTFVMSGTPVEVS